MNVHEVSRLANEYMKATIGIWRIFYLQRANDELDNEGLNFEREEMSKKAQGMASKLALSGYDAEPLARQARVVAKKKVAEEAAEDTAKSG